MLIVGSYSLTGGKINEVSMSEADGISPRIQLEILSKRTPTPTIVSPQGGATALK